MKKPRCIIYGGAGFIGSHLAEELLSQNFGVTIFDKVNTSTRNVGHILEDINFIEGDFNNKADIRKSLKNHDYAVHLVSSTLPANSIINPIYDIETNLISSINLFDECLKQNIKKVIFISSGGTVYGIPDKIPIDESHQTNPINSYGIIKLAIEKYLYLFNKLNKLNYTILRFSNPFGERQNPHLGQGLICNFLYKIKNNLSLHIWGNGKIIRDYFYIKDGAKAIYKALITNTEFKIFNIGSGRGISINDILKKIEQVLKLRFKTEYFPPREIDVPVNVLNNNLAKKYLDWKPVTTFDAALRKTWKYILNE